MKIVKVKNYDEMSYQASLVIKELLQKKPDATLGLATGSSPIGLYQNLIKFYEAGEISFKDVKSYNLDEYCELPRSHPESYYSFMHRNLFDHVDIKPENINIPCSEGSDLQALCKEIARGILCAFCSQIGIICHCFICNNGDGRSCRRRPSRGAYKGNCQCDSIYGDFFDI
mgnify:CR=1 FL=1